MQNAQTETCSAPEQTENHEHMLGNEGATLNPLPSQKPKSKELWSTLSAGVRRGSSAHLRMVPACDAPH